MRISRSAIAVTAILLWVFSAGCPISKNPGIESASSMLIQGKGGVGELGPSPPLGLTAENLEHNVISLNWIDTSDNETGFMIFKRSLYEEEMSLIGEVASGVNSYHDIGLCEGFLYYYQVFAFNEFGISAPSNVAYTVAYCDPTPSIDEVIGQIDQFYIEERIKNFGQYNSLRRKAEKIRAKIEDRDFNAALNNIKEMLNHLWAQFDKGIEIAAMSRIDYHLRQILAHYSLLNNLPYTMKIRVENSDVPNVSIHLPDGNVLSLNLFGNVSIRLEETDDENVLSFKVVDAEYITDPVTVLGIHFGRILVTDDENSPGFGTLNLSTGEIYLTENVCLDSLFMRSMGISPVSFSLPQRGSISMINADDFRGVLVGSSILPSSIPLIGGCFVFC